MDLQMELGRVEAGLVTPHRPFSQPRFFEAPLVVSGL